MCASVCFPTCIYTCFPPVTLFFRSWPLSLFRLVSLFPSLFLFPYRFLAQSSFRLYACPLIAGFCLQDQIIVTAVECSLRGASAFASAFPTTQFARPGLRTTIHIRARIRLCNRTGTARLFIEPDRPIHFDSNCICKRFVLLCERISPFRLF